MSRTVSRDPKVIIKPEQIRKLPLELTRLDGELSDFTHKAMFEPVSSSFYASLGFSILESLIRLKSKSFLTESAWSSISEKFQSIVELAKELKLSKVHSLFQDFLQNLKESNAFSAKKILDSCCSVTSPIKFELSIKLLFCSVVDQDYKLVLNGSLNEKTMLKDISKNLSIHILHIENNHYSLYNNQNIAPLVYLYSNKNHFGIIYHSSIKYLDEKPQTLGIDFRSFPFLYNPSKKFNPKVFDFQENAYTKFFEIIKTLTFNLKPLNSATKAEILKNFNFLKKMCPELTPKISELCQSSVFHCGHDCKDYTPVCLKPHCLDCLIDKIKNSYNNEILCPCGIPLDLSDLNFLTNELSTPKHSEYSRYATVKPASKYTRKFSRTGSIFDRKENFEETIKRLPVINNKIICVTCRKSLNKENFNGIKCTGHNICINCRGKRLKAGDEQCPACLRLYTVDELTILRMVNNSADLTSSFLNVKSFIDTL